MVRHAEMNENDSHKGRNFCSQFPRKQKAQHVMQDHTGKHWVWSGGGGAKETWGGKRTHEKLLQLPQEGMGETE